MAALVWTLVIVLALAIVPLGTSETHSTSSDGIVTVTTERLTLIENEGPGVLVVLLIPSAVALVGLTGAAFRVRAMSIGAAGIACAFCFLAMLSIGVFYLPAAVLVAVAAARQAPR